VHQFARFLPKHTIARSDSAGEKEIELARTGERQVEAVKHSVAEEEAREREAGRAKGKVDWRYALIAPAAALVAGAIWHLGWRRPAMKKKLGVPHAPVGKEHLEVEQPIQKKAADVIPHREVEKSPLKKLAAVPHAAVGKEHMEIEQPILKKKLAIPHGAVGNPHMEVKQPDQKKKIEDANQLMEAGQPYQKVEVEAPGAENGSGGEGPAGGIP
jgi:hypothetical protein